MWRKLLTWAQNGAMAYSTTLAGGLTGLVSGGLLFALVGLIVGGSAYLLQQVDLLTSLDPIEWGLRAGLLPGLAAFGYSFGWVQMSKFDDAHLRRWSVGSAIAASIITPAWLWLSGIGWIETLLNASDTLQTTYWLMIVVFWSITQVLSVRLPLATALRFGLGNAATFGGILYLLGNLNQPTFPLGGLVSMGLIVGGWVLVGTEYAAIYEKLHPGKKTKWREKSKPKKKAPPVS